MGEPPTCRGCGEHVLGDGTAVLVRLLLPSDRDAVAAGFEQLSSRSRRTRFFAPPEQLSEEDLDYLTVLDYDDHFAIAAFAVDEPGSPGIGIARYVRDADDHARAEVAVTVLDRFQRRGLGTLLTEILADNAVDHGITTFVYFVLWDNDDMIGVLQAVGARVMPDEPGIARIELDLPVEGGLAESTVRRVIGVLADRFREMFERAAGGRSPAA